MTTLSEIIKNMGEGVLLREGYFEFLHKADYATQPQTLTFMGGKKYIPILGRNRNISSVICTKEVAEKIQEQYHVGLVIHDNPRELFYKIHMHLSAKFSEEMPTFIDPSVQISNLAIVSPHNVRIGKNCVIEEGVVVKPGVTIGDNSNIRSGAVLGAEGYELVRIDDKLRIIPHYGELTIGDNVDIFSNSTICKAIFKGSSNIIEDYVFIDCLVHVAHGVRIGRGSKIAAHAVIAGNVDIGQNAWIGPGAVISNGIKIGNEAFVALGSVVISNLDTGTKVSGNFAVDHDKNLLRFIEAEKGEEN